MKCDNISECHDLDILNETKEAIKAGCNICGEIIIVKKDAKGNPEPRSYAQAFRKEILQPGQNLYYRYHHASLRVLG